MVDHAGVNIYLASVKLLLLFYDRVYYFILHIIIILWYTVFGNHHAQDYLSVRHIDGRSYYRLRYTRSSIVFPTEILINNEKNAREKKTQQFNNVIYINYIINDTRSFRLNHFMKFNARRNDVYSLVCRCRVWRGEKKIPARFIWGSLIRPTELYFEGSRIKRYVNKPMPLLRKFVIKIIYCIFFYNI